VQDDGREPEWLREASRRRRRITLTLLFLGIAGAMLVRACELAMTP